MKKFLYSVATVLSANFAFSQITLEHSYPNDNLQVYTNGTETFYYSVGSNLTTIKFYNADYTLKKQFTLPSPVDIPSYENFILSKNIFNTDNLLEIVTTSGNTWNDETIRIYNEDGVLVKDFGSGYTVEDIYDFHVYHDNTTNTNKLRLIKGDPYGNNATTEIWNLPSTSLAAKEIQGKNKLSAFPIPANKILNVINPENGANKIEVFDTSGKLVLKKSFSSSENKISVDVENLPKGIYIYKIGELSSKLIKN